MILITYRYPDLNVSGNNPMIITDHDILTKGKECKIIIVVALFMLILHKYHRAFA